MRMGFEMWDHYGLTVKRMGFEEHSWFLRL